MNIIYVSSLCDKSKFSELFDLCPSRLPHQSQKYHQLITEGLRKNNISIHVLSDIPYTNKQYTKGSYNMEEGISYFYLSKYRIPVIKNIYTCLVSFYKTLSLIRKLNCEAIVCDVLKVSVAFGALAAAKLSGTKILGIVTDVPGHLARKDNISISKQILNNILEKINMTFIKMFDGYVFLTEYMNALINPRLKPHIVIEGQVDSNMNSVENRIENKSKKFIFLYAGEIKKMYGIDMLVKAFLKSNLKDAELHIYGDGDYAIPLRKLCEEYSEIKYFGVRENHYIIKRQLEASILINPRPTNEEYTQYSFPSKNMEYMVSGTPVLTTCLPGMPKEYYPYIYLIGDETEDGIASNLKYLASLPAEELHKKGLTAKEFVLCYKNNIVQSKKIIDLIRGM